MESWNDDHEFWELAGPVIFSAERTTDARRDAEAIVSMLGLRPGARVLDMCAGTGRHAVELARRGCAVTAVDRSRSYLAVAREAACSAGVELELVEADMGGFRRPGAFDAALNLYTSFGYLEREEDDRRVAENLRASLTEGGSLLMELAGKEIIASRGVKRGWSQAGAVLLLEEAMIGPGWEWIAYRWIVVREGVTRTFHVRHRLYSGVELRGTLLAAGFRSVELYGGFDGRPYDAGAELLIAVARR